MDTRRVFWFMVSRCDPTKYAPVHRQVLMRCPCVVLNYSVEHSLQPRVSYLEDLLSECPPVNENRRNLKGDGEVGENNVDGWANVPYASMGSDWDEPLAPTEPLGPPPESLVAQVILRCVEPPQWPLLFRPQRH